MGTWRAVIAGSLLGLVALSVLSALPDGDDPVEPSGTTPAPVDPP